MSSSTDACTAAFCRLQDMVAKAEVPRRPRTIEEEDLIALEDLILHIEGPEALERYQQLRRSKISKKGILVESIATTFSAMDARKELGQGLGEEHHE